MFRKMLLGVVGAFAALAATFGAPEAKAQGFGVSVGFGGPAYYGGYRYRPVGYRYGGYYGPRRVVRRVVVSRPVYYAPRRVVYSRPVYYAPRPVYRRVVVRRPVYRRVFVNRPVYYGPRRFYY